MTRTAPKPTTLVMLEEQLQWAYEGSTALNGQIDWHLVQRLRSQIEEAKQDVD